VIFERSKTIFGRSEALQGEPEPKISLASFRFKKFIPMLIKIFSLAFDPLHNGFDDSEIRDFIKDKEVLSIQEFFFVRHQTPYLALVVKYQFNEGIFLTPDIIWTLKAQRSC